MMESPFPPDEAAMVTDDPAILYRHPVMREIRRLLSWQDREKFSKTSGCFDRTYWGWKFTDFPGARFQEGIYALAHLFSRPFPGNDLSANQRVLDWARAGMNFWRGIQYQDGSFDEAYPFERSLAATSFTSFYVGEAFLQLADHIPQEEKSALYRTFERAGDWLCKNDEHHGVLSNHLAAAAAALHVIYRICGEERYEKRSRYFLQRIYERQSEEGWYEEYGGADPGYQTHGTFYLAVIWQDNRDAALLESLQRSLAFLKYFIHPNGTLGGEYGSRNTEFYFPAGFEILAGAIPDAALIARFMRASVEKQTAAGLSAMDAYNFLPLMNNYLFAADHARSPGNATDKLPCQQEEEAYFPDAGLYVKSNSAYYSVLGLSKGGVLKVYNKVTRNLAASDCGYWSQVSGGAVISSQSLRRPGRWSRSDDGFTVEVNFAQVNQRTQSSWLFIGFRLFSLTVGRLQTAAYWLKNLLVKVLVQRHKEVPLRLIRRVHFKDNEIVISDRIEIDGTLQISGLQTGAKFSTIHMGSSRYFQHQELDIPPTNPQDLVADLIKNRHISVDRVLRILASESEGSL
ncbi:MAG: hypothetical protein H0U54_11650 [Acidobacteria bacterium]|nr:hypothetical protein [Acidobacteriota bacterium]